MWLYCCTDCSICCQMLTELTLFTSKCKLRCGLQLEPVWFLKCVIKLSAGLLHLSTCIYVHIYREVHMQDKKQFTSDSTLQQPVHRLAKRIQSVCMQQLHECEARGNKLMPAGNTLVWFILGLFATNNHQSALLCRLSGGLSTRSQLSLRFKFSNFGIGLFLKLKVISSSAFSSNGDSGTGSRSVSLLAFSVKDFRE